MDAVEDRRAAPRRSAAPLIAALSGTAAAVLLAILLILVQRSITARDAAFARREHSMAILLLTSEVGAALARAEAALPRFIVSGDPQIGTLYYDAWRAGGDAVAALARQVAADPEQAARVRAVRRRYAERAEELSAPTVLARYKRGWAALGRFSEVRRTAALDGIDRGLRAIADAERTRLDARATVAEERLTRSDTLVWLLSVTGVALMLSATATGWAALAAFDGRREAKDQADAESDRAGTLALAVADRTAALSVANDELRREGEVRAAAEAKLRQIEKMDAVGQLTGGIAHDFNNMLAVVVNGLEIARARVVEQAAEASRHIDSAMEGAERAAALTRRLLTFSRAEPLLPAAADAGAILRGMAELIDRTIGERIAVTIHAEPDLWPVWIDRYQLENAILNLCVNARDAMLGDGTIRITARNARPGEDERGALAPGDYVAIAVADDGAGMSAEVAARAFEPFFTTKPVGQGTGLGLSQIFGFARQSGGDVTVASAVGHGTTVTLLLPRHAAAAAAAAPIPAAPEPAAPAAPAARGLAVLVVEDDARVRRATTEALAELGHRPTGCAAGADALRLIEDGAAVDLVLSDVMMPAMTGPELAERIARVAPGLPVLFCTGFAGDAAEPSRFAGRGVLRKPYTMAALAGAVAAAVAPDERAA